jgi:8-oxo-dGTP pyrophosphatase MutT (NUDIX family)
MIAFDLDGTRFNLRAAGVCVHASHVLLARAESDDFWYAPGGRCEAGESSAHTLRREMREELGLEVGVGRLLWLVENFFPFQGKSWHELAFYYELRLPAGAPILRPDGLHESADVWGLEEDGAPLRFRWHPLERIPALRLYPTFLRQGLLDLPEHTRHLIHTDPAE